MVLRVFELLFAISLILWAVGDVIYPLLTWSRPFPILRSLFHKKTKGEATLDNAIDQSMETRLYREAKRIRNS